MPWTETSKVLYATLLGFVAALSLAGPATAQRPKQPVTPPPEGRITRAPPELVGAAAPCNGCPSKSVNLVVENTSGTSAVGAVKVDLFREGTLVASKVFDGVPPHGQRSIGTLTCHYPQHPPGPGPGGGGPSGPCDPMGSGGAPNSYMVVDAANAVAESKESNNIFFFPWKAPTTFAAAP